MHEKASPCARLHPCRQIPAQPAFPDIFSIGVCVANPPIAKTPVPRGRLQDRLHDRIDGHATARDIASLIASELDQARESEISGVSRRIAIGNRLRADCAQPFQRPRVGSSEGSMVTAPSKSEFVRQENVRAFLVRLETERDPATRALLTRLLAEHSLAPLLKAGPPHPSSALMVRRY